jgi:transcription termination/antitermination protein NusG
MNQDPEEIGMTQDVPVGGEAGAAPESPDVITSPDSEVGETLTTDPGTAVEPDALPPPEPGQPTEEPDALPDEAEPTEEPDALPDEAEPAKEPDEPGVVEPAAEPIEEPDAQADAAEPTEEPEPVALEAAVPEGEPDEGLEAELTGEAEEEISEDRGPDPMRGPGDWYVVHTYAGYENKVKANLESRVNSMLMQDKIFDVHIPMEDVMEIKGGKKQVVQRKVFPGYLLVKMIYDNDSWYVVRNTPGVTGFVSSGTGTKPTPLSRREVEKILAVKKEVVKPTFRLEWEEGDMVRIISGPFADFNGHISEINVDQSKLKVLVNIFDRETPVELGFDQVAKV